MFLGNILSFFFLIITIVTGRSQRDKSNFLTSILSKANNPIVVFIGDGQQSLDPDNLITDEKQVYHDDKQKHVEGLGEDEAYILYHLLRTTPDEDDSQAVEGLQDTKQALRQILRARCKRLITCVAKCTYKPSCPSKCQKKYDDLDLCESKPKPCKKSKCGKTMPPNWWYL